MQALTLEFSRLRQTMLALPVLQRPPVTVFEAINPPQRPTNDRLNFNIALGGGSSTIVSTPAVNTWNEILGGYVRQTAGAARNWVIEYFDGTTAFPVSDNNSISKSLTGKLIQLPTTGHIIRVTAEAAADQGTWMGVISRKRLGFGAMPT